AVGAGISTILLLGTLRFTRREQKAQAHNNIPALLIVSVTGGLLIYGTFDLPIYGDANSPANQNPELAQYFLQQSSKEIDVPNVVTSVLASYRGYDTLGETAVVFTAAIGVLSLLGLRRRRSKDDPSATDIARQQRPQEDA
ncbi:MAG: hydrogen gas-evolving membrane-bound hydrogenase subunit E, partial [Pseudomonadota bacterium]